MQYSSRSENYSSSLRDSPSKWSSGKESKGYAYKTASYQYSSAGSAGSSNAYLDKSVDKNIDQLDALLEDLKNERQITRERDHSLNYRTLERSSYEDPVAGGTVTKSTRVIKTSNVQPGLDDAELLPTSNYSTLRSNGSLVQSNDYQTLDKSYGSRNISPGGFYEGKKTQIYESNRSLNRPMEIIPANATTATASTAQMEKDLGSIALTEDILPVPGTKVTTTVRTYTYEIPANAPTTNTLTRKNLIYNNMQTNEMNSMVQAHPAHVIPPTVVYNTESYSTLHKGQEKPIFSNQSYESREHYETNTMRSTNALPPAPATHLRNAPPGDTTIVYNINNSTTTTTRDRSNYPHGPNQGPNVPPYAGPHSPRSPHGPTTQRCIYKETTNTVNNIHSPAGPTHEPLLGPKRAGTPGLPNAGGYPPTITPPNVTYKYSSTTTNTRRAPDYGTPSPTLPPAPFPLDGVEYPMGNANPPQRVEDLMQSLGNQVDVVDKADLSTPRKREIETAVATSNQQQIIPSVNRAGKEVYYPPGHEMMLTKREEMAAGSAGGGRWAKASGMYEYESGYKSKTKTKSGAAMVPVCLPLCCAMPCSIM